ncbi:MAG TPA: transposase [Terracidiphilus sp.]|nr:transposase [Terracidiphilus sp.]
MKGKLVRYQKAGAFHFITFSCYRRLPLLNSAGAYACFERELEIMRRRYDFVVLGYVLMPEHVHLLVSEPRIASLAVALQVLKQQTSRKLKRKDQTQFWQRRYYDFNVWSEEKRSEKIGYMHRNPVVRDLVAKPEDWPWSSARHYSTGLHGTVEIESFWTAWEREERQSSAPREIVLPTLAPQGWGTHVSGETNK